MKAASKLKFWMTIDDSETIFCLGDLEAWVREVKVQHQKLLQFFLAELSLCRFSHFSLFIHYFK